MADEQDTPLEENLLGSLDLDEVIVPDFEKNTSNSWDDYVKFHCDQAITKIRQKEEEVKQTMSHIEKLKISMNKEVQEKEQALEDEYQNRCRELKEREAESEQNLTLKIQEYESKREQMNEVIEIQDGKVKLDVGGHIFTTSKVTLCRDRNSMIAVMFSGRHNMIKSDDGSYFIDRDGTHFRYILNYLRGVINSPSDLPEDLSVLKELRCEADFFQLVGLTEMLNEALDVPLDKIDYTQEEITEMMSTLVRGDSSVNMNTSSLSANSYMHDIPASAEYDPVGRAHFVSQNMTKCSLNFTNKRLNGISFAHSTFFHNVSFRNACLVGASFYGCEFGVGVQVNFNYADLTNCDFRQCKGKEAGSNMNFGHGGGLVSASSSDTFLQMVKQSKVSFKKANIDGALFDPKVFTYLRTLRR